MLPHLYVPSDSDIEMYEEIVGNKVVDWFHFVFGVVLEGSEVIMAGGGHRFIVYVS